MLESTRAAPPSEVAQISSRRRGSATIGEARTSSARDLLAVAGVRVGQPVAGVLDLHGGEVGLGGAEELHAAAGVQGEVGRVGGPQEVEAEPVRVVAALAADGGEEALGRGVGADHEGHVAQAGQDLGPGRRDGGGPRGASGVAARHPGPGPAQGLGEGGSGHEAGVAVADGVGAGDELDVAPRDAGVGEGWRGSCHPVLDEVAAPFAPGVHAHAEDGDLGLRHLTPIAAATGRHFHTRYSCSSSS